MHNRWIFRFSEPVESSSTMRLVPAGSQNRICEALVLWANLVAHIDGVNITLTCGPRHLLFMLMKATRWRCKYSVQLESRLGLAVKYHLVEYYVCAAASDRRGERSWFVAAGGKNFRGKSGPRARK